VYPRLLRVPGLPERGSSCSLPQGAGMCKKIEPSKTSTDLFFVCLVRLTLASRWCFLWTRIRHILATPTTRSWFPNFAPSLSLLIFDIFFGSQILLSEHGSVLYQGPTGAATSYFEAVGFPKTVVSFPASSYFSAHTFSASVTETSDGEFLLKVASGLVARTGMHMLSSYCSLSEFWLHAH
jgi:hypothetical protein